MLHVPFTAKSTFADRSFSVAVWDILPLHIKSKETYQAFKDNVKTFLFTTAFGS